VRATRDSREQTLARLREGYACGELETGTFSERVDAALRAGTEDQLRGLTVDLPAAEARPAPSRLRRALAGAVVAGGSSLSLLEQAQGGRVTLGRHPECELVFDDPTVSRRHAILCRREDRWFLQDLDSSNGTWVNGRRVYDAEVRPGDEVCLGSAVFRL